METRHLRYFLVVCEHNSVAAAASPRTCLRKREPRLRHASACYDGL